MEYIWNPWHGCHKCSVGCANCYVYYLDGKRDKDANIVTKSKSNFNLPLKRNRNFDYKIPDGAEVATCFTSDFFLEEADGWREDAWRIIKERKNVDFLICTKRIARAKECLPSDWWNGYHNVIFATSCETQRAAEERLPFLLQMPCSRRYILAAPLLENIDFSRYLVGGNIDTVSVGGESYDNARECDFEWVENIFVTCKRFNVKFDFHQTGSNFVKEGKRFKIKHNREYEQAKKGLAYLLNKYSDG